MEPRDDGPSFKRDLALATWGLFVGLAFLLLAAGLFGTLLGVRSELVKLPTAVSSLISASYYLGFLVGSRAALSALGRVGHIRVYAALASLLSAAMLTVGLTESAPAWAWLRFVTGLCLAGQYVVAESWLNDLATNENRGRLLAVYSVVTSGAFGIGQLLLFRMDARAITGFAIASIITSLAVAPVALSEEAVAPSMTERESISLRDLAKVVPTGVGSCLLVGIAHGALTGMAAIYATTSRSVDGPHRVVRRRAEHRRHVAALAGGGDIGRHRPARRRLRRVVHGDRRRGPPAARAVDQFDGLAADGRARGLQLSAVLRRRRRTRTTGSSRNRSTRAASQLVTLYGLGAVIGPFAAAGMMILVGAKGFFWAAIILHGLIAAFFLYRIFAFRETLAKRPWSEVSLPARAFFVPATVVAMGRRYRTKRAE